MIYKITLTSQTDYNYYVFADSLEEALEEFDDGEQFKEDHGETICVKKTIYVTENEKTMEENKFTEIKE